MMDTERENLVEDRRTDRAAEYTARAYSGGVTVEDKKALDQWLAENPKNRTEYQEVLDTWHFMGVLSDRLDELALPEHKPVRQWPKLAMAAGFLLAVSVAILTIFSNGVVQESPTLASYSTTTGEQRTVELEDGSIMILNTNTRVLVDYSDSRRRTILEQGEAFYEVTKDPSRPFVVDTGSRSITVLGTKFDVLKAGLDLEVAVVEGIVAVHRTEQATTLDTPAVELNPASEEGVNAQADTFLLTAGVQARFSGTFASASASVESESISKPEKFPYWRYGSIRFNNQPLYEVVKELNRYTKKKVLIEDSRVMHIKVSGVFQLDTVESVLHKMEKVLPLKITRYPDRIVIVGR